MNSNPCSLLSPPLPALPLPLPQDGAWRLWSGAWFKLQGPPRTALARDVMGPDFGLHKKRHRAQAQAAVDDVGNREDTFTFQHDVLNVSMHSQMLSGSLREGCWTAWKL